MAWGTQHPTSRNFPAARRGEAELFPMSRGVSVTRRLCWRYWRGAEPRGPWGFPADDLTFPWQHGEGATGGKGLLCVLPVHCGAERGAGRALPRFYPSAPSPGQMLRRDPSTAPSSHPFPVLAPPPPAPEEAGGDRPSLRGSSPGSRRSISSHLSPPRTDAEWPPRGKGG